MGVIGRLDMAIQLPNTMASWAIVGARRMSVSLTVRPRRRSISVTMRVAISECPVHDPMIVAALACLKEMTKIAMPSRTSGRLIVTKLDHGLDVSFDNRDIVAAS